MYHVLHGLMMWCMGKMWVKPLTAVSAGETRSDRERIFAPATILS